ncbi:phage tail protein [Marinomonas ostreistagni]|uniref:Tail fiber protein n=1 Tax=Marinomonas ostreistagni TaxID=359209 RepID=A0ABS0ZCV1_9GAMM|nr:tail fiber protein [Marinomonas ostreistagni]MBJ7551509.1 tail fiber protein [Marinomonas ostreistagni]
MENYYYGTTLQFAGSFAPANWSFCHGQQFSISQNTALYAILGTLWGGDGRTTFSLPDMRGRTPVGYGNGPGLAPAIIGQRFGLPTHELTEAQLPSHTHAAVFEPEYQGGGTGQITATATVNAGTGSDSSEPTDKYWGVTKNGLAELNGYSNSASVVMAADAIDINVFGGGGITGGTVSVGYTGASQAFSLYQPSTVIPFIICIEGLFPSRN